MDKYKELREGLARLKAVTGELRGPEAEVEALLAERDALRVALQDCVAVMENELNGLAVIRMELKQARIALDQ